MVIGAFGRGCLTARFQSNAATSDRELLKRSLKLSGGAQERVLQPELRHTTSEATPYSLRPVALWRSGLKISSSERARPHEHFSLPLRQAGGCVLRVR